MDARPVLVSLLTFTLLVAATNVRAQVGSGEITGIVRDQAGAAVPGADVAVMEVATGGVRVVTSTDRNVSASCAMRSAPSTVLWSLIVTCVMPRSLHTR